MLPVIDTRRLKVNGELKTFNICWTKDKREVVFHADSYYYLSKDGLKITTRQYKE